MFVDSHCHITCDEMYPQIDSVLDNMKNLDHFMIMCTNLQELERALKVKENNPKAKVAFGYFPSDAKEITEKEYEILETILKDQKIDVLGEIGLDYHWDDSFKEEQKELFIRQIQLANQYNLPIAIHMRDATKDSLDILKEYAKTKIIFHCFSGSKETMEIALKMNSFISFAGPITFKNNRNGVECVKACPIDRILSETDSPYLTPVPFRGKRNEPKNVEYVERKIAEVKDLPLEKVCDQINKNFASIFE